MESKSNGGCHVTLWAPHGSTQMLEVHLLACLSPAGFANELTVSSTSFLSLLMMLLAEVRSTTLAIWT